MKLSDVMSAADLSVYAQVGLVLFMLVFLAVLVRVMWPGQSHLDDELVRIPFSDESQSDASVSDDARAAIAREGNAHG